MAQFRSGPWGREIYPFPYIISAISVAFHEANICPIDVCVWEGNRYQYNTCSFVGGGVVLCYGANSSPGGVNHIVK